MKGECADFMNENLMNHPHLCGNKSLLIDYLYGECDTTANEAIKAHLSVCTACAEELDSLRAVRGSLEAWTPPEPALGFKVVQEVPKDLKFWARIWELGGWALPAAAVFVLAVAAAIANVEVRYDHDGFVIRTGWISKDGLTEAEEPEISVASGDLLLPLDSTLSEQEMTSTRSNRVVGNRSDRNNEFVTSPAVVSEKIILQHIGSLIEESETRQQRAFALHVAKIQQELDAERQADMWQIEQRIGWLEGMTGTEIARQRELVDYLVRISER